MMHLVKNNELKSVASIGNQIARRMIGGNSQGQYFLLAAVIDADIAAKGIDQPGIPLVQQVNGGRDHDGRTFDAANGLDGDKGFARASWQHDTAPPSCMLPGFESFYLVVVRLAGLLHLEMERLPARHAIAHLLFLQVRLNTAVMVALAAPALLNQLKRRGWSLLCVYIAQNERAALVVD